MSDDYFDQQAADDAAYQANMLASVAPQAPLSAPPAEAAPSSPAPEAAPAAQDWTQTVNDIYQQEFGRQADPSGMASFTAALNSGLTGEQMREALRSSAEGQSLGLSGVDPGYGIAVDPNAGWEWQQGGSDDYGSHWDPYWRNVNTGEYKSADSIQGTGVSPVDVNNLAYHVAPNYEGTPTQFYDESGNLKGVLVDMVGKGGNGQVIVDPNSLGLILKKDEKPSVNSQIQARDEQGRLLFVDPTTGEPTIYNTGVPLSTGQTVKDQMYINDPGNRGGIIPADVTQGMISLALAMASGGVGGALLDAAGFGADAALASSTAGELGFAGGTGLTDAAANSLMGEYASNGLNYTGALTTAAKSAAINAAVTAAQGGKPADILKAAGTGAIAGGAGALGTEYFGAGTVGQIATQSAVAAGLAAATGGNPAQAALTGAISATLANVIPAATSGVMSGLPESVQRAVNTAISSSVIAAVRGGNIGTAALMGAVNSAITSVAGAIGDTQVVKDLKDAVSSQVSQVVDSLKFDTGITNTQALPVSNPNPIATEQPDVVNSVFSQDMQDTLSRTAPPLVQDAINRNQPAPQASAEDFNNFFANYTPTVGAPLTSLAGATTSDINPVTVSNKYGSAVPQVDADGNVIRAAEPLPPPSALTVFGQGTASALDNTVGAVLPTIAQMASYLGLRTFDQIAELTSSILGDEYTANPDAMREISNRVAELLSQPFGKAADVISSQFTGQQGDVTGSKGYEKEVSGQVLRFISENIDKGADYLSEKTGLPAGDIRLMTDAILMRPGAALSTLGEARAAVKDVGRGYVDAATGIVNESPTSAYNLGATVADLTRAPDGSLIRGESNIRPINLGEIVDERTPYVSPEKLTGPTRALEYSTPEAAAPLAERAAPTRDVASIFNDAFAAADKIPTYDVSPATQLATEPRGALPTKFAESIKPIDLGPNIDSSALAKISTEAQAVDQNLSRINEPEVQAQTKAVITDTYQTLTKEPPSKLAADFYNNLYFGGAQSSQVVEAIKSTVNNPSAPPDTIIKQVDQAVESLNPDDQLPAKLKILSNASKLGITPAEAIDLGLINKDGTETNLGELILPKTKTQTETKTETKTEFPVNPVKPVKPVFPPPPIINPPPPVPPINPPINPPIDNPSINPPPVEPVFPVEPVVPPPAPPLVAEAIKKAAAPAASAPVAIPSYMSGVGTQGEPYGALPGNLKSTFLQGVNVKEYNPFENYNVYQQIAPVHAAQGGSPLQLAQMQQGIYGVDPSLYSVLQKRQAPNYFTYGADTSGGNPTTFAGSQLMGKPSPVIPLTPTGKPLGGDWLYQGSGSNPLAMAGTGISNLPTGMMAEGGQAHGEHVPEFITGATGHYVKGRGDGQSDDIPAMLADGEYVFDADTVAQLGNGSSDAGAAVLDKMREAIRAHKRSAPVDEIPPKSKSPLEYLAEATKGKRK